MKETIIFIVVGAIVLFLGISYAPQLEKTVGINSKEEVLENNANNDKNINQTEKNKSMNTNGEEKLVSEDLVIGTGEEAKLDDTVSVHYTGTLLNGTKFDSSVDKGTPFEFKLGSGQVIKGWDDGVLGMKVGGKRKLTIPASLAYGARAMGDKIPANSTLVFEIELLNVKH